MVFQCDPGFVPEGEMTAVCGRDGQWTPNPGGVTCSYVPAQTSTQRFSQTTIPTQTSTPTGPGENEHFCMYYRFVSSHEMWICWSRSLELLLLSP